MKDILGFAPVLIALVTGLLGIFFGKTGEANKLSRISYVFIALVVASAAYGAWDLSQKIEGKRKAADAAEVAANEAAELRRLVELDSFDLARPFEHGVFLFDIGLVGEGEAKILKGFTGPFPVDGGRPTKGKVTFGIAEVFDYRYDLSSTADGTVTLTRNGVAQSFRNARPDCYTTNGTCEGGQGAETGGVWGVDFIVPEYSHWLSLKSGLTLNKLVSRALDTPIYGTIEVQDAGMTRAQYADIEEGLKALRADMKFYAPMIDQTPRGCPSVIHLPVVLRMAKASRPGAVVIEIAPAPGRFSTVECEESPF